MLFFGSFDSFLTFYLYFLKIIPTFTPRKRLVIDYYEKLKLTMLKFILLVFTLLFNTSLIAQLADGTTAPDWSASDINGTTHNLYQYLNQDKAVIMHFMTTNCSDCWTYHESKSIENFYTGNGPNAANYRAMAFLIESDATTGLDCIEGKKSCSTKTKGNWVSNRITPIINNNLLKTGFQVTNYPHSYLVCPDKKIYSMGLLNNNDIESQIQIKCSVPIAPLSYFVSLTRDNKCKGDKTGLISVIPSGGVPPYQYKWSNGETNPLVVNLAAGKYTCTITDNQSKTIITEPISILEPNPIVINTTVTAFRACGDGGSITSSVSGGTQGYLYSWSGGLSSWHLKNVLGGEYQLTITDANGCKAVSSKILVPSHLNEPKIAGDSIKKLTCTNQSIAFSPILSPDINYNYVWYDEEGKIISNEKNIANLTKPGVYLLRAQDKESFCSKLKKFYILRDESVPNVTIKNFDDFHCNNNQVELEGKVADDNTNYTFQWRKITGDTFVVINHYHSVTVTEHGTYILKVVNKQTGCEKIENITIKKWENPTLSLSQKDSILCKGDATAQLISTIKGGKSPFFYEWSTGDVGLVKLEKMTQGKYSLTITDANLCKSTEKIEITEPSDLSVSMVVIKISNANAKDGAINLTISGGTPPYTFQWFKNDTVKISINEDVFNLGVGTYHALITDANGCKYLMKEKITLSLPLRTENVNNSNKILCFPNPTDDLINIVVADDNIKAQTIELIDIQGNIIKRIELLNNLNLKLDLSDILPGCYIIKVKSKEEIYFVEKLIVF